MVSRTVSFQSDEPSSAGCTERLRWFQYLALAISSLRNAARFTEEASLSTSDEERSLRLSRLAESMSMGAGALEKVRRREEQKLKPLGPLQGT
jgi:hypothetical protein